MGPLNGFVRTLLDRAQRAGAIRSDITTADVRALFMMLGPVYDLSVTTSGDLWRRALAAYLAGTKVTESQERTGS